MNKEIPMRSALRGSLVIASVVLVGAAAQGAAVSTNLTVNGSGTVSSSSVSASGTVTLSGIGSGTFSSNFSFAAAASGSAPLTITVTSGSPTGTLTGTITGSASLLLEVFAGSPSASGPATIAITSGTGGFAGTTGTFNITAAGTGAGTNGSGAGTFSLTGPGTLNISGATGGGGTSGGGGGGPTPTVNSVTNAAGYIPQNLPGGGVAQGALMVVKGTNLGPASVVIATSFPLQTTLGGTSVSVTVGGQTVKCIMYYTLATQVAAILPSATPVGTGTITVTYNGTASATAPIIVVANNFNTFTVNQGGSGDAIAFLNSDNGLITPVHSANPGETVVLWGTGLGAVTGDETEPAVQVNLTNVPIQVYIGGQPATVLFRGRNACCSSVDTVYVTVPAGVSGCVVPVITQIGNNVGNGSSIAVATSGRTCTPTNTSISGANISSITSILENGGTFSSGGVSLSRTVSTTQPITVGGMTVGGGTTSMDSADASFSSVTVPAGGAGASSLVADVANYGACTVVFYTGATVPPSNPYTVTSLDAGPSISLIGPGGPQTLTKSSISGSIYYSATLSSTGNYLSAGSYTATGPGGANVGPFSASLTLAQPLVWTNQASITTVNRAAGQTVTWTGGDPAGYVQISGSSFIGSSVATAAYAYFTCTAQTNADSFNIPSYVLLALPPSGSESAGGISIAIPGSLSVGSYSTGTPFTATGLTYGYFSASVTDFSEVTYQ
jgi:uncharacterized protein (TIGR03437 family)